MLVKIDMANAFNTLRRDHFLRVERARLPGLYRHLWQAYSEPSCLLFGESIIPSSAGLQQGDPLGPLVFSLGVDEVSRSISSELNIWFLDDATIGGPAETVLADLENIIPKLREIGLTVNDAKCELLLLNHPEDQQDRIIEQFRTVLPHVQVPELESWTLLGAPLSEAAIGPALNMKEAALRRMVEKLRVLDPHQALVLLKNCFSIPKLLYILRTSPTFKNIPDLETIDNTIKSAVSSITNIDFTEENWTQLTLPTGSGGLGLRRSQDLSLPGYIPSAISSEPLVDALLSQTQIGGAPAIDTAAAITIWQARTGVDEIPEPRGKQRSWDAASSAKTIEGLLSRADQISRARILSAQQKESAAWLNALPIPSLGNHLDSETLRIAIALRVGAPICVPHRCRCGGQVDPTGHHGLSCRLNAGRFPRHAQLNDIIKRALASAGVPSILEPQGTDRGDGKRPDGMTIFPWKNGRSLVWDATCVDTFAPSNVISSAINPTSAAEAAEVRKRHKYRSLVHQYHFEPFAVETSGAFGPSTSRNIMEIGRRITAESGEPRETAWLRQRLSLAIIRGNATSIRACTQ